MPSIGEITTAVHDSIALVGALNSVQNYNELTEGMNTLPGAQIYPESGDCDAATETDRTTFVDAATGVPGVRQAEVMVRVDVYARQRSQLAEDWDTAVDLLDAVYDQLETQGDCPLFGLTGIRSYRFTWQRVVFEYATIAYTGFRFELFFRVF